MSIEELKGGEQKKTFESFGLKVGDKIFARNPANDEKVEWHFFGFDPKERKVLAMNPENPLVLSEMTEELFLELNRHGLPSGKESKPSSSVREDELKGLGDFIE